VDPRARPPDGLTDPQAREGPGHSHAVGGRHAGHGRERLPGRCRLADGSGGWRPVRLLKATESTDYTNPYFTQQYNGSYAAGIIRGTYHFAIPADSGGATQADYFVANGGGWSGDGMTLPGTLDIEWNPYGADCYGLTQSAMVGWIQSFVNEYQARTGRWPVIYTAASWWSECTGNTGDFSSTDPLWVASYSSSPGVMPYNWGYQTIWQYADSGTFPGDQDSFNGDISGVRALANG
jgi:GH25 family lysozyme M1 (1,4-beta-N-acetylmuramidase)